MRRRIVWETTAKKYLDRIEPEGVRELVENRILDLATITRPQRAKKLGKNIFRIRQGQYRIIFGLSESEVKIHRIGNRRDVYRKPSS